MTTTAGALFVANADGTVTPTELARGPWTPEALHGGPVAALVARAVEQLPADDIDWFVSRLTVDLERPVPPAPLVVTADITRPGRKVSLVDVTIRLATNEQIVTRARALRIRAADVALANEVPALAPLLALELPPTPGPHESIEESSDVAGYVAYHSHATEHRFARGAWSTPGPVVDWIRLRYPVVDGEQTSPLQRVAAAADFANGISKVLSFETHLFINPDLTIHQFRDAQGEWIGVDSRTHHGERGVGVSDTALYDVVGRVGRSNQSLLIDVTR